MRTIVLRAADVLGGDGAALARLAILPPPSIDAVASAFRRDVVREDEDRIHFDAVVAELRRASRIQMAWLVRRLRRELAS